VGVERVLSCLLAEFVSGSGDRLAVAVAAAAWACAARLWSSAARSCVLCACYAPGWFDAGRETGVSGSRSHVELDRRESQRASLGVVVQKGVPLLRSLIRMPTTSTLPYIRAALILCDLMAPLVVAGAGGLQSCWKRLKG